MQRKRSTSGAGTRYQSRASGAWYRDVPWGLLTFSLVGYAVFLVLIVREVGSWGR